MCRLSQSHLNPRGEHKNCPPYAEPVPPRREVWQVVSGFLPLASKTPRFGHVYLHSPILAIFLRLPSCFFSDACKTVFLRAPGKDANERSGEKRQPERGEISVVRSLKYGRPFSLLPSFRGPHVSSLSPLAAYAIHEANRYSQRRQKERPLVHSPIIFYLGSPILFLWYLHILHTRFFFDSCETSSLPSVPFEMV